MAFTLSLRFPAERYVAAGMARKDEVEWPPHPARLLLGLLATHYRGDAAAEERRALQWLSEQPPPHILLPSEANCSRENMDGVFVPQNPTEAKDTKHPRKPRCFPSIVFPPDQSEIFFHWPDSVPEQSDRECLASLATRLPRFGHSSSLVLAQVMDTLPEGDEWTRLVPLPEDSIENPQYRLRVPWPGLLSSAESAFAASERDAEFALALERRDASERKGKPLTKFEASPRGRFDARHISRGYVAETAATTGRGHWEGGFVALRQTGGERLGLETTWQLTTALHKALLDRWTRANPSESVPPWISGHAAGSGTTLPSQVCHLAMFPLPHVGHIHAKGHLLGIGFAVPNSDAAGIDRQTMRQQWRMMLAALFGSGPLELSPADRAWTIQLLPEEGGSGNSGLTPATWIRPARIWTSVTPVVLDRHPKPSFEKDPEAWLESCRSILAEACQRIGLPSPEEIQPSPYSPLAGVPPAPSFKAPAPRPGRPARFHIHAAIRFPCEISGPVLLGAGRYRGYGLFRPSPSNS